MSGTLTLLPANFWADRGNWTTSSSAVNLTTAVNDGSDSTYDLLSGAYSSSPYGASMWQQMTGQQLPNGARVTTAYAQIRCIRTGATIRYIKTRLAEQSLRPSQGTPVNARPIGADEASAQAIIPSTIISTISAPGGSALVDGGLIDQQVVNNLWVQTYYLTETDTRVHEVRAIVKYDEKPTATVLTPTGTVTDEGSPVVTWTYLDDLQPQVKYQVQLIDSGGNIDYDSGAVTSGDNKHNVTTSLTNDSYTVSLKVAQRWDGPGGEFWSDAMTGTFTLAVEKPAAPTAPTVTVQDSSGRILLTVPHNLNLLNYDTASMEYGPSGIFTTSGITSPPTRQSTQAHSGTYASQFTINGTPGASGASFIYAGPVVRVEVGQPVTLSVFARAAAGSTTNTWVPYIRFIDSAGSFIGTSTGVGKSVTSSAWIEATVTATAPANTYRAIFGLVDASAPSSGHAYYFDDFYLAMTSAAPATDRRGGFTNLSENLLSWDNSSLENGISDWEAKDAGSVIAISATQAAHGGLSLRATRTGSTGATSFQLTSGKRYMPCVAGNSYRATARVLSGTSRTVSVYVSFYDASLTLVAAAGPYSITSSTTAFTLLDSAVHAVPAGAVYAKIYYEVAACTVGEFHYFDAMFVSMDNPDTETHPALSWDPGKRTTIEGPFLAVEYTEDNGTSWYRLGDAEVDQTVRSVTLYDYENGSGRTRKYRAYIQRTDDDKTFTSDTSSASSAALQTLSNVWLHSDSGEPIDSARNFRYDGTGRGDSIEAGAQFNHFAGRAYPQVDFSEDNDRTISVTLELPGYASADAAALLALAKAKNTIVFRDQRGRRLRGALTGVAFADEVWGQSATLTVHTGGDQWPYE